MDAFFAKKGIKLSRPTYQTNADLLKSSQKNNNKKPIETLSKYQINQSSNKSQKSHPNNNTNRSFDIKPQISDTKDTRDTRDNINMFNSNLSFMSNQEPSNHHHANNHHSYSNKPFYPIQPKNIGFTPVSSSNDKVFNLSQDKGQITSTAYKQRSGNVSSNSRQKITALPYKYQPYEVNKQTSAGYFSHNKQYHTTQSQKYKKTQNSYNKYESYKIEPDFNSYSTYGTYANLKDLQSNAKLNKQPEQTSSTPYIPYENTQKTPKYSLQNSQISQKLKLMKQINQKSMKIRQLQTKIQSITKQSQSKVFRLQYQLRFLQESNKRLSQQSIQTKQRLVSQREKREKLQNQMNKQIFFKQDLKYAKDYDNLTERYQKLQSENTKMYNQHSIYILQMSQIRKNYEKQLNQLQEQYNQIKAQFRSSCLKIQKLMQVKSGEDKMTMIKLQSQINFIKKKNEQLLQTILQKQKESEELHRELQHIRQQQKNEIISVQDQFNFTQIKQSIDQYQLRILRFQNVINEKDGLIQEQKDIIEGLYCQIRAGKKDNQIIHLKEKSYQNNLKNQIEMLKINMQNQTQIYRKKVSNIEDALQRKIKQNSQKDKFIKNFLLSRLKQLEGSHLDQVLQKIQTYFNYQCQQQMKRQLKLKQERQQKLMQERQQKLQQEKLRQEKLKQEKQDKLKQQQQNKQKQILIQGQNHKLQQQIMLQQLQQKSNETQIQHQRQQNNRIQQLQVQNIIPQKCQSYPNISQKELPQQTLQNSPIEIQKQQTQQLQKQLQQPKCQTIQQSL